ncbi:putative membrane-bound nitrate reductase [Streptomyces lydicamycinicus]|uniref:Putative membrane-bound nitrate reductase n=1 Tax=Streptomyces lydicamycinicus TaxID=1546107 RepID=A0A0P4R801_9ACTN|nr:hypothetical protein [Streptomyces lydicamycinicus]GAO08665.1 putative membrane-bound nitrate reductase [Streptomyces lydicamycinicus]
MLEDRSMRELLGPVAAVALIAQLNPDLPAPRIEFAPIHHDNGEYSAGVRLLMYKPEDGVYERWAHLIGSSDPDSHTDPTPTPQGNLCRRTYGDYADIPVEAVAYVPRAVAQVPPAANHWALALKEPAA